MKMKLLIAGLLASLMMAGSALAMDSEAIEKHMAKIDDNYANAVEEDGKTKALEEKVEELEEMIKMMLEEDEQGSAQGSEQDS